MLHAADLTVRGRFEEDRGTSDAGTGEHTEDWQIVCTRWALVRPAAGDERFARLLTQHPGAPWAIAVRYDRDTILVRPPQRFFWISRAQYFTLLGTPVDPDGSRRELHFPAADRFPVRPVTER